LSPKQKHILEIAEKLFSEHGFDGTSVRAIASAAEVNVSMISYYFGSKEKLLEEIIKHRISDSREQMEVVINSDRSFEEKLETMVSLYIRRIHNNHRVYRIVNIEYSNGSRTIDFDNIAKDKMQNYQVLERFILDGQEAGVFKKEVEIPLIIPTILGLYFHFDDNKPFYLSLLGLKNQKMLDDYVLSTLTNHLQQTIKGLLLV